MVTHAGLAGIYFGPAREAWQAAAALSAKKHIIYVDKPYKRVLSIMPEMYDDLWTAAKGMYKMEPAVADGGEVVIYAPHITEVSYTHGRLLDEIGYHCRDYFIKQWDKFRDYPGGVLAHSTHLKGMGEFDSLTGIEKPRITVTLATGISPERCRMINLGYLDPASVNPKDWENRENEGILVVPRAGEMLYRMRKEDIMKYKIGVVGLGVMGHNLALNMERNGFPVAGYDLDAAKTKAFLDGPAAGKNIIGVDSPAALMAALEKPRRILMMVPAGAPVDSAIAHLKPHMEPGDILMDGGNSFFMDTERRSKELEAGRFQLHRHGCFRRRRGRPVGACHHAGRSVPLPGRPSRRSCRPSPPKPRTASPAWPTWDRAAPVITSRWCTTASNTATCS